MLGCAIAEGLFANKNSLLNGQLCLVRELWVCKNRTSGSLFIRCKSTDINCRNNYYGKIIRREEYKPCALQLRHHATDYNSAVQIQTRRFSETKPYDIETNLDKDVILFKYENPKYFKRLNIFAISQILFWTYLAHFVFTGLRDIPVSKMQTDDLPWWRRINFGETTHRTILTGFTFFVGFSLFALAWVHTVKSVRYLVLRKGGNEVTLITYSPFGENRLRTVPLNKMTSKQSREAATVHLPLKVKGDWMHYLLDMRGEFKHPRLFDFTAGLKRPI